MSQSAQHFSVLDNISKARLNMVERQVRAGGITNPQVLEAMARLPRENFIPTPEGALAYAEVDAVLSQVPGASRYLLNPPLLARLIDAAGIHDGDLVLDIGCANGYSTAILSDLVGIGTVVGLESNEALAILAQQQLENLNKNNVVIAQGQLIEGYPQQGPYDVILLQGASAIEPRVLEAIFVSQLREHGRFVGVFDDGGDIKGQAWRWTKEKDGVRYETLFDARAPLLPSFDALETPFHFPGVQVPPPTLKNREGLSYLSQPQETEWKKTSSPASSGAAAEASTSATSSPTASAAPTASQRTLLQKTARSLEQTASKKVRWAQRLFARTPKEPSAPKASSEKIKSYADTSSKLFSNLKKGLQTSTNLLQKKEKKSAPSTEPSATPSIWRHAKALIKDDPPKDDSKTSFGQSPKSEKPNAKSANPTSPASAMPLESKSPASNPSAQGLRVPPAEKTPPTDATADSKTDSSKTPTASTSAPTNPKGSAPSVPAPPLPPQKGLTAKQPSSLEKVAPNQNGHSTLKASTPAYGEKNEDGQTQKDENEK